MGFGKNCLLAKLCNNLYITGRIMPEAFFRPRPIGLPNLSPDEVGGGQGNRPGEQPSQNRLMQAMKIYLGERWRLRQQGYFYTRRIEQRKVPLADAYHNDIVASEKTANDALTPSAKAVRKAGDISKIKDHFEMFALAHFSLPKALEIMDRKTREMQQVRQETSYNPYSTVTFSKEELETVQMLLSRAGGMQLTSIEGWTLTRVEMDDAWTAIISTSLEPIEQAIQDYTSQGKNQGHNLIIDTVDRIKRQLHTS